MKKNYIISTRYILIATVCFIFSNNIFAQLITLGSGTVVPSGTTAGPINEYYRSLHCQIVYTAAELNNAGITGGTLYKMGFYVESGVTYPLPNYTIKMKHTSAPDVATYDGVGLTTQHSISSYSPVAGGFDMLTLNTPFIWNGVDNILVDVCFDQVTAYTSTGQVRVYTPTVPNGFIYERSDSSPQCGVVCSNTSNNKPQIQFEFIPPSPIDLGVSLFVKPTSSNKCFGNDTIVARVKNYGTDPLDLGSTLASIVVQSNGANTSSFTLPLTTGTLAPNSTTDYVVTTNYNMSNLGTYYLKGYTTVFGDGSALNDTIKATYTKSPQFTKTILPNDTVCQTIPVFLNANVNHSKQVGLGNLTNDSFEYPAPYGNYYEGAKHHFLILASELSNAGLTAGNFTKLGFNATNLNSSDPLLNYNIGIATTTVSSLSGFSQSIFINYVSIPSYTPVLGMNNHQLSMPFSWDGVSNLVIETCFDNTSSGFSNNVSVTQSATSFTSSVWYRADAVPSICTETITTSNANQRPNFYFEQIKPVSYLWSPAIGLNSTTISNPVSILTNSQTYTVNVTTGGCMSYDTLRITTNPAAIPQLGADTNLCFSPYTLKANVTANGYLWNNSSVNSSISVNNTGKYWVQTTSSNGCVVADTINIVVSSNPIVTLGADTAFCAGSSINLYCGNAGSTISWNTGANTPFITVNTVGTYSVLVTNSAGCKESDVINVTSKAKPTVSLDFTGQTHFCPTSNNPRPLIEGIPSGGTYIGSGVSGNNFIPSMAGQGSYVIIYNYTGPNGCSNTATDMLTVDACVGVEELTQNINLNVYPNPNSGAFTIEINSASNMDAQININTVDGRLVYNKEVSIDGIVTQPIDLTDLANGIYYLTVKAKDVTRTFKILKQ